MCKQIEKNKKLKTPEVPNSNSETGSAEQPKQKIKK